MSHGPAPSQPWTREDGIAALADERPWDLAVIGGGASGLGVALEAASRGLRTLLVEAHDFAKGTSSRSTKLVHGGVRYMSQGNIGLVRSALRERARILANAPHVAHAQSFLLPVESQWQRLYYGFGLRAYDRLAGQLRLGATESVGREQFIAMAPSVRHEHLVGAVMYTDGQFDDARLAISLARSAVDHGATLLNYVRVTGLHHEHGRVAGLQLHDVEGGGDYEIRARAVVNATGVFADTIRRLDDPAAAQRLVASQGIHLVVPRSCMPCSSAIIWPKTHDGRVLFAVPWHGVVLIGTTDTPVAEASLEPRPLAEEVDYLFAHIAEYLDPVPTRADVLSVFAGLRPLVRAGGGRTAAMSRDHEVEVSPKGLVSILGGKWTTYRLMGEDTVDAAIAAASLTAGPSVTADLRLHGADGTDPIHGRSSAEVRSLMEATPDLSRRVHPDVDVTGAQVVYAARHELARTVEDILARRSRALLLNAAASVLAAPAVADLLATELGRDAAWQQAQITAYTALAARYTLHP